MVVVTAAASARIASICTSTDCLSEVLQVGQLTRLRGVAEVGRKLSELARRAGVTLRLSCLRGALQVRGNLLRHLFELRGVRHLKLLQSVGQLRKWRKPAAVGWGRCRRIARIAREACRDSGALESSSQHLLQIGAGGIAYGTRTHGILIGGFQVSLSTEVSRHLWA